MEASRAESPGYLSPSKLTFGELAGCVAALVFALSLFLPWYGTSETNPNSQLDLVGGGTAKGGDTVSAWQMFPILRWILLAAVIAPFILAWIVMRRHKLEWKPGEITMIVGAAAFVLVLCKGVILGRPGRQRRDLAPVGLSDRAPGLRRHGGQRLPAPVQARGRQEAAGRDVELAA